MVISDWNGGIVKKYITTDFADMWKYIKNNFAPMLKIDIQLFNKMSGVVCLAGVPISYLLLL